MPDKKAGKALVKLLNEVRYTFVIQKKSMYFNVEKDGVKIALTKSNFGSDRLKIYDGNTGFSLSCTLPIKIESIKCGMPGQQSVVLDKSLRVFWDESLVVFWDDTLPDGWIRFAPRNFRTKNFVQKLSSKILSPFQNDLNEYRRLRKEFDEAQVEILSNL